MELSKSEMEDIWLNKPIGYFSSLKKKLKGTKKYRLKVMPIKYEYLPHETFEVRAKNLEEAYTAARQEWYTKFKDSGRPDAWRYSNLV